MARRTCSAMIIRLPSTSVDVIEIERNEMSASIDESLGHVGRALCIAAAPSAAMDKDVEPMPRPMAQDQVVGEFSSILSLLRAISRKGIIFTAKKTNRQALLKPSAVVETALKQRPRFKKKGDRRSPFTRITLTHCALAAHVTHVSRHRFEPGDAFFHRGVRAEQISQTTAAERINNEHMGRRARRRRVRLERNILRAHV
jgi:hypothetical protein